ncbi:MAG TPA: MYXO-CTERM sorting domain-containing protein [Vulgatibacter sp.]
MYEVVVPGEGCSAAGGLPSLAGLMLAGLALRRRRR